MHKQLKRGHHTHKPPTPWIIILARAVWPIPPPSLLLFQDATLPLMVRSAALKHSTEGHTNHALSAPTALRAVGPQMRNRHALLKQERINASLCG